MALMVGLNLGCVTRLKKTWEVSFECAVNNVY